MHDIDPFRGFPAFATTHGQDQARKIIENEKVVLAAVAEFVQTNTIDCDLNLTTTMDVCLSQEFADQQAKSFEAYKNAGGGVSHIMFYTGEEAKMKTRNSDTICAYEWPAGSTHPAKLTQWVLEDFIKKGGKLWTYCPANKIVGIQDSGIEGKRWEIHTPRGTIVTETVIHCTNAYAPALLPELVGYIVPFRSQVHAFVPTAAGSGCNMLQNTLSLRYGLRHYFSVNQRPKDGIVIFGGTGTRDDSDQTTEILSEALSYDDSKHSCRLADNSKREFSALFSEPSLPGEGLEHVWTGILGMTPDHVPLIGPIDGLDGQWICAGFNGHGMSVPANGLSRFLSNPLH
jgi:glycine/D-amino acid oxidase-like deaminating enzyme